MARRIEPARRSVALAASALLVWAALSPAAAAQNPGDYEHLIDLYAAGDIQNAVAVLGGWTTRSVTAAARGPLLLPDRQRAAVMLHTDVAAALTNIDNVRAFFHLEFAAWWADAFRRMPTLLYEETAITADESRVFMEYVRHAPNEASIHVAESLDVRDGKIVASHVYHGCTCSRTTCTARGAI